MMQNTAKVYGVVENSVELRSEVEKCCIWSCIKIYRVI